MKKRILSFLLALVMVAGLLPAAALTAFAAQYTVVGVIVRSDGVVCDDGWYFFDDPSIYLFYSDNRITVPTSYSSLYTDEECLDYLSSAPVLGEKYYFQVSSKAHNDTDYSVTNSQSSIDVEGFCRGRVEDAYMDGAVYIVTCSIIYGELTGGVKAVASGVEYDSAKGGYAPNFTTLKAISTEGKELEHTVLDGNYHYYGATAGLLYKNRSYGTFSDKLTTEPQEGETYYSYILLDSIDGNLNIEEDLVDIQIPGYDVKYLDSYESDMGFTSMVVYKATKVKKVFPVYVGGVGMNDGDYLAVGATKTQTTKPSGGYAYYKNGKLTLNNYSYEGKGYQYDSEYGFYAVIYTKNDLTLELIGNNTLTQTKFDYDMIYVDGANLTVGGDGKLTGTSGGYALRADKDITINGGTVEVSAYNSSILSYGDVIINGGDIVAESVGRVGISANDITINGGDVTAIGGHKAIHYDLSESFSVAEGMKIQASTTVDGELGEYVSANRDSYKKITIHSHNFGTAWKYKEADGHAHACVCGTHDELIPHTPGAEATETTPQKCTECAYIITPALNHVHNLTKISAKPATCTEEGNAEFYICDGCSNWFEDAEGNVKIEDKASVKFVATGHAFGDEFKSDENEHWYECACGEKKDVAAHNDENGDSKCDACGYSSAPAETEPAVTTPSGNTETTAPDKTDDENKGGMPWWAILLIVVAVAGISVGVTVIVLKKKK